MDQGPQTPYRPQRSPCAGALRELVRFLAKVAARESVAKEELSYSGPHGCAEHR